MFKPELAQRKAAPYGRIENEVMVLVVKQYCRNRRDLQQNKADKTMIISVIV